MMIAENTKSKTDGFKGIAPVVCHKNYDLVNSTVIDYLHCICLGTVKHTFELWTDRKYKDKDWYIGKWTQEIDLLLDDIKVSRQTSRPPRNFQLFSSWKGSEFRNLLVLYSIVFQYFVSEPYLSNFLKLSRAIYIFLGCEITVEAFEEASQLIFDYVTEFQELYGLEAMVHNMHLVSHIPQTVIQNGPLWCYSAFCFENKNGQIKNVIKGTNKILQETATKFAILQGNQKPKNPCTIRYGKKTIIDTELITNEYNYVYVNGIYFGTKANDHEKKTIDYLVETKDGKFCEIEKIVEIDGKLYLHLLENKQVYYSEGQFKYYSEKEEESFCCDINYVRKATIVIFNVYTTYPNAIEIM